MLYLISFRFDFGFGQTIDGPSKSDDSGIRTALELFSEVFEIEFTLPEQLLHANLPDPEGEEDILRVIAYTIKEISLHHSSDETLIDLAKDRLASSLEGLDQFQKHEIVLMLCSQLVDEPESGEGGSQTAALTKSILALFPEPEKFKVYAIINQLNQDVKSVREISEITHDDLRAQQIAERFPENRRRGASAQIESIIAMNQLIKDFEKLQANLDYLVVKSELKETS